MADRIMQCMYDTNILTDKVMPADQLVRAFAVATNTPIDSVAALQSEELDGAVDAWADPETTTVLRYWNIPGEFPFVVEVVSKQEDISSEDDVLAVLKRVSAELDVPLARLEPLGRLLVVFPDGPDLTIDEDRSIADPEIALSPDSRLAYNATRARVGAGIG